MDKTDILALVGAAAWLPQIIQWIIAATKRPKIRLIPLGRIQMGYEFNGPVIGITASVATRQKDALITQMTLTLTHAKGEERKFNWAWLSETPLKMRTAAGEMAEFLKNQPAIALQISTLTPAEKFIAFRDFEYATKYEELTLALVEHREFVQQHEKDFLDPVLKSKEFAKFRDFYLSGMYWKEGDYDLELKILEAYSKSVHTEQFSFHLDKADIETLRKNCELFEKGLREFAEKAGVPEGEEENQLKYIYPKLNSV